MQLQFTGRKPHLRDDQSLQASPVRSAMFKPASTKIKLDHPILTRTEKDREGELRSYPAGPRSRTRGGRTRRSCSGRSRRAAPRRPQAERGSQLPLKGHRSLPQRRPACSCSGEGVRVWGFGAETKMATKRARKGVTEILTWTWTFPWGWAACRACTASPPAGTPCGPQRRGRKRRTSPAARESLSSPLCSVAIAARPSNSGRQPATNYGPWA